MLSCTTTTIACYFALLLQSMYFLSYIFLFSTSYSSPYTASGDFRVFKSYCESGIVAPSLQKVLHLCRILDFPMLSADDLQISLGRTWGSVDLQNMNGLVQPESYRSRKWRATELFLTVLLEKCPWVCVLWMNNWYPGILIWLRPSFL